MINQLIIQNSQLRGLTIDEVLALSEKADALKNKYYQIAENGESASLRVEAVIVIMLCQYIKANCQSWNLGSGRLPFKKSLLEWLWMNRNRWDSAVMDGAYAYAESL